MRSNEIVDKLRYWRTVSEIAFLNQKRPFALVFRLTHKCNLKCSYCDLYNREAEDMDTRTILAILKSVLQHNRFICLSGGEPLLRKDIYDIITYIYNNSNTFINLNTNGILLPEHLEVLQKVDNVAISLDGPKNLHNELRGRGSYEHAIRALEICKRIGTSVSINTVLTKKNINNIDDILNIGSKYDAQIFFCPVYNYSHCNDIQFLRPSDQELRKTFKYILSKKKIGANIGHHIKVLEHFSEWPDVKPIRCKAGKGLFMISADGSMHPCCVHNNSQEVNVRNADIMQAFKNIEEPECHKCMDLNYMETVFALGLDLNVMYGSYFSK